MDDIKLILIFLKMSDGEGIEKRLERLKKNLKKFDGQSVAVLPQLLADNTCLSPCQKQPSQHKVISANTKILI